MNRSNAALLAAPLLLSSTLGGCVLSTTLQAELVLPDIPRQSVEPVELERLPGGQRRLVVEKRVQQEDESWRRELVRFEVPAGVAVVDSSAEGFLTEDCIHDVGLASNKAHVAGGSRISVFDGHTWHSLGVVEPEVRPASVPAEVAFCAVLPVSLAIDTALFPIEFALFWTPLNKIFEHR